MYVARFDSHLIIIFHSFLRGMFFMIARLTCVTHDPINNHMSYVKCVCAVDIIFGFDFIKMCVNQTFSTQSVMF